MSPTPHLGLPLVAAAQAQKHVTVNEALSRLDALAQITALSRTIATPPATPAEGDRYIAPPDATGAWSGAAGQIALYLNGGWELLAPQAGWRAWIADEGVGLVHDGAQWAVESVTVGGVSVLSSTAGGAEIRSEILEADETVPAGASFSTMLAIPDRAVVLGVTGRVTAVVGGAVSWRIGVAGADDRYGSGIGVALQSELHGLTGQPQTYWGATPLLVSAEGGVFAGGGTLRLAIHCLRLAPPALV